MNPYAKPVAKIQTNGLESVEVVERPRAGGRERRRNAAHERERDDHVLAVAGGLDRVVTQRFEDLARIRQHAHRAARPRARSRRAGHDRDPLAETARHHPAEAR